MKISEQQLLKLIVLSRDAFIELSRISNSDGLNRIGQEGIKLIDDIYSQTSSEIKEVE